MPSYMRLEVVVFKNTVFLCVQFRVWLSLARVLLVGLYVVAQAAAGPEWAVASSCAT